MNQQKQLSEKSVAIFKALVPKAVRQSGSGNPPLFQVGSHMVRVKRAGSTGNQGHPLRLETVALHIPGAGHGEWFLVSPIWQMKHALSGAARPQHALHPLECMFIDPKDVPPSAKVDPPSDMPSRIAASPPPGKGPRDIVKRIESALMEQRAKAEANMTSLFASEIGNLDDDE